MNCDGIRGWTSLAAAVVALLLAGPRARAGCALGPPMTFAPPPGAALPPNPTIYLFLRHHPAHPAQALDALEVTDGTGRAISFSRVDVPNAGAADVVRIDVRSPRGALVVRAQAGDGSTLARYRVRGRHAALTGRATKIVAATYLYASGCPGANGFLLSVTPRAPAYRVELEGKVWIVPDDEEGAGAGTGTIAAGDVGCDDFAIPTDRPLALSITPLGVDGSEGWTRSEGCTVEQGESCVPLPGGGRRCTGPAISCSTGATYSVRGRVVARP